MFGIKYAIIIIFATLLSLIYAKFNGVYEGVTLDNFRQAKAFVFMPAVLYCLPFLIIDTREQGERYLLLLVVVFGLLNIASIVAAQFGIEINTAVDAYVREEESRKRFIAKLLRAMAFIKFCSPTISGMIAWRDGIMIPEKMFYVRSLMAIPMIIPMTPKAVRVV